jgi:hypothetical protein
VRFKGRRPRARQRQFKQHASHHLHRAATHAPLLSSHRQLRRTAAAMAAPTQPLDYIEPNELAEVLKGAGKEAVKVVDVRGEVRLSALPRPTFRQTLM